MVDSCSLAYQNVPFGNGTVHRTGKGGGMATGGKPAMEEFFRAVGEQALSGAGIGREEALRVLSVPPEAIFRLLSVTDPVRRHFRGDAVRLCSIVNAKSGGCSEDCSFCAQSSRSGAAIDRHSLLPAERIVAAAKAAKEAGAREFSLVASGLS